MKKARQKYWQVLPVGPTSYGDSPYQSFSAFAGNPYFIDLDTLVKEGLLTQDEINACYWGDNPTQVAYDAVFWYRFPLLKKRMREVSTGRNRATRSSAWTAGTG